jgi:hypothetical protein
MLIVTSLWRSGQGQLNRQDHRHQKIDKEPIATERLKGLGIAIASPPHLNEIPEKKKERDH